METYCYGYLPDMGTEWDWIVFYWRLWTGVYGAPEFRPRLKTDNEFRTLGKRK